MSKKNASTEAMLELNSISAKDLKKQLADVPDTAQIIFYGDLTFNRIDRRGKDLYQFEFNEVIQRDRIFRDYV